MKVYLVKLDWSTEDSNDIELFVYGTYDKAYEKFKELIANEMNPDNSWVGELEWENGVPKDDRIELAFRRSSRARKTNACTFPFPMSGISPTNGTAII